MNASEINDNGSELTIFPNPGTAANRIVTLRLGKKVNRVSIQLHDLNGRQISSYVNPELSDDKVTLELPLLSHGVYLFRVQMDDAFRMRKYVIKE
jgi:hypothetical protein